MSYFVCGDAAETSPQMVLDGDRNIGTVGNCKYPPRAMPTLIGVQWTWLAVSDILGLEYQWTCICGLAISEWLMAAPQQTTVFRVAAALEHRHQRLVGHAFVV